MPAYYQGRKLSFNEMVESIKEKWRERIHTISALEKGTRLSEVIINNIGNFQRRQK